MKKASTWLGYEIFTDGGPFLKPQRIKFWSEDKYKHAQPELPLNYHADALLGLAVVHLNPDLKNPFTSPDMNYSFCHEAWNTMEPHWELYQSSQLRVQSIKKSYPQASTNSTASHKFFEKTLTEILDNAVYPWGLQLLPLHDVMAAIDHLEDQLKQPLLYNFELTFSKDLTQKLHHLYSLLFNLRAMVAIDYNSHIDDYTYHGVRMDSINDYLPRIDFTSQDALIYASFKQNKDKIPDAIYKQLRDKFLEHNHNACCLVEQLPHSFTKVLNHYEVIETLHQVQVDWIMGTDAGLLYKIRDELLGLHEGYEKIFWNEAHPTSMQKSSVLSLSFKIDEKMLHQSNAA